MAVLSEGQRRSLEKAVQRAREIAEDGARAAITQLAVHNAEPFSNLTPEERDLRNRLRARARQLGDTRHAKTGEHGIEHLVVEVAYEHWHRMLFARFLAENNVLMHPDGVPVTLEECEELAPEEGAADGWELASWYAEGMLPQIFRPGSPVFELKLPPEKVRELERLLADLPAEVFTASDSLGWVYQFWQAKKKDEVNKSEVKIGADELPAVTQLFTEPYMVQFLLHNTLGAWWVARHGQESLPVQMPYLRFCSDGTPAAGTYDRWPKAAAELRVLDPSCGSGHFLVAAFDVLVRFRMVEEGLEPQDACAAVLRDNLHGLEIDERCTQIAAFALALTAWTFPGAGGYRRLPELHLACSGLAPRARREVWLALAGDDVRLRNGMDRLFSVFQDAPTFGSLIDPTAVGLQGKQQELGVARFEELQPLLDARLDGERVDSDAERRELGVAAKGIISAADLLASSYTLVVTNVPYLSGRKQTPLLFEFVSKRFPRATSDLSAACVERIWASLTEGGVAALVTPQMWLFTSSYEALRKHALDTIRWRFLARLGPGAFETIGGHVVNVALTITQRLEPNRNAEFGVIDATSAATPKDKAESLRKSSLRFVQQQQQRENPGYRITGDAHSSDSLLSDFVDAPQGIKTGDDFRWRRYHWELPALGNGWEPYQSTVSDIELYGGRSLVIDWSTGGEGMIRPRLDSVAVGKRGVAVSQTGDLPCTLYDGHRFDSNVAPLVPSDPDDVPALWAFCSSPEYSSSVREIDQSLKVSNVPLTQVHFDVERWRQVAADQHPSGMPEPHSNDPTQWVFKGLVAPAIDPLQVGVSRLLGYRWPKQENDGLSDLVDDDGIVCLPAVRAEQPAATRLQQVLARAYGNEWTSHKQARLLDTTGCKGWTLDRWLNEKFFQQHCKVFQSRPFIWHIWDGLKKGGFSALVNYHKLNRNLLETLTYNYLGDWIRRQQDDEKRGVEGAGDRLVAAKSLQDKLKLILKGEPPCDIFVRWKPLEQQPMGWEPDINDGVRVNIRPFMLVGDVGKKGAGILRDKPNINWNKDRGSDSADAPWYELGPKYGGKKGDRINDHHLTLAEKQAARDAAGGGS